MAHHQPLLSPIDWRRWQGRAPGASLLLRALSFDTPSAASAAAALAGNERALALSDAQQVTLLLLRPQGPALPPPLARRVELKRQNNALRLQRLQLEYVRIAEALEAAGLRHVLLKGFLQAPEFAPEQSLRPQYDIDLLLSREEAREAQNILIGLGYASAAGNERFPTDHLPPLIRKTGWEWRGDYFDPDIPPVVELHFQLWDAVTERFAAPGIEEFSTRPASRLHNGRTIPCLSPVDALGYACLHVLRHLLRGNLKLLHVFELAWFQERRAADGEFWRRWNELHPPELRRLQAIPLVLARKWFGCRQPAAVQRQAGRLSPPVRAWLEHYAAAPAVGAEAPNKQELWLHLSLLTTPRERLAVLRRRLAPASLPGPIEGVFSPARRAGWKRRVLRLGRYLAHLLRRGFFHVRTLAGLAAGYLRWRRLRSEAKRDQR